MDDELERMISVREDAAERNSRGSTPEIEMALRPIDPGAGLIEIQFGSEPAFEYTIKPLAKLYGPGSGKDSIDPTDPQFMPLLLGIEESILSAFEHRPTLTDAAATTALQQLAMSPEMDVSNDDLAEAVQYNLRLTLSLNDYSRQDVRHALRKIGKSIARHTRTQGPRGYLTFIKEHMRR